MCFLFIYYYLYSSIIDGLVYPLDTLKTRIQVKDNNNNNDNDCIFIKNCFLPFPVSSYGYLRFYLTGDHTLNKLTVKMRENQDELSPIAQAFSGAIGAVISSKLCAFFLFIIIYTVPL